MSKIKNTWNKLKESCKKAFTTPADAPERPDQFKIPQYYFEACRLESSAQYSVAAIEEMRRQIFKLLAVTKSQEKAEALNEIETRIYHKLLVAQTAASLVSMQVVYIEQCPGIKTKSFWTPGFAWANNCFDARELARQHAARAQTVANAAGAELALARQLSKTKPERGFASAEAALAALRELAQNDRESTGPQGK